MFDEKKPIANIIFIIFICGALLAAVISAGCTQNAQPTPAPTGNAVNTAVTFTDSTGSQVTLPVTAERIIATNSNCLEMLIAIGAQNKIVGIDDYDAKKVPLLMARLPASMMDIGSWQTPDVENILALKPDVVICYSGANQPKNYDQLLAANITIVQLDCYKLNNLSSDARALGAITGNVRQAGDYAAFLSQYTGLLKNRTANLTADNKPLVYWEEGTDYTTAGKGTGGDDMVKLAGGNNVAGNNTTAYPKINNEWIISEDPSFIFKTPYTSPNNTTGFASLVSAITSRPGISIVDAVKNGKVYIMTSDVAYGPRSVIGALYTAKILHPDLFKDIDPASVMSEYAQKYLSGADKGIFVYPAPS